MLMKDPDALVPKRIWAPRSLSSEGEEVLLSLVDLGVEKGMLSHEDGKRARLLLKVNPTAQLCLLGTRIEALSNLVKEVSSFDSRISTMSEGIKRSHDLLTSLLMMEKEDV